MTVWHFNWTAPKHHLDIKLIRKEGKNLMFICLFQNDDTIGTRRLALVFTTLEADWHKSNSAFFVKMSQNVPDVGLNSSNLFLLTLIGERQKKNNKKNTSGRRPNFIANRTDAKFGCFLVGFFFVANALRNASTSPRLSENSEEKSRSSSSNHRRHWISAGELEGKSRVIYTLAEIRIAGWGGHAVR